MERREFLRALAIADPGFAGYVHEYSPTTGNDAVKELAKAMEICAV